ncbi:MAG: hypothetical protein Unbinned3907contig1000_33 [Prokaryotic dsDNA virus sp.]|nr:MAG: hypothetical protein Unbinned3907contig1000_33 [Prokaryotic dsDNA virus sp.]|tara:strand:- start:956 stop:1339 length:384 start_codon:yes stop_codon:yes gene_type:complete
MNKSVRQELLEYIEDSIKDRVITNDNIDEDWHHILFNQDYYIIGYYNAEEFFKQHNISVWEAIQKTQEYEMDNFGKVSLYPNPENVANLYTYICGEELLSEANAETIEELQEFIFKNLKTYKPKYTI